MGVGASFLKSPASLMSPWNGFLCLSYLAGYRSVLGTDVGVWEIRESWKYSLEKPLPSISP